MFGGGSFGCDIAAHIRLVERLEIEEEKLQKIIYENAKEVFAL